MAHIATLLLLWVTLLHAANPADSAVFGAFQHTDSAMKYFALLQRTSVSNELDLVIARGSPKNQLLDQPQWTWWSEQQKIGLFLQEKTRPGRVYSLGIKTGFPDCAARIERVTATDAVISCQGEKSERYPNQKWVYDVKTKSLIAQLAYQPFSTWRVFPNGDGAVFVASDAQRLVAIAFEADRDPEFRILTTAESAKWLRRVNVSEGTVGIDRKRVLHIEPEPSQPVRFGPADAFRLVASVSPAQFLTIEERTGNQISSHPLPQSTYDQFAAARPPRVKNGYVRQGTVIEERIGPWKLEPDKIWFGKTFYDGEGTTGVGGFGYFGTTDRTWHLFTPPEILDSSSSAIDVSPDAIWLALASNGEYGGTSNGLLRYDRQSGTVSRLDLPDIGGQFIRTGGKLLLTTNFGLAVVELAEARRYFIDRTTDGRLRLAEATR